MSKPTTTIDKTSTKLEAVEITELLAYGMYDVQCDPLTPGSSALEEWQTTMQKRQDFRHDAEKLQELLLVMGVELRVSSKSDALKALKMLITIPEKVAYKIGAEE